jgi:hypothetical protein
MCVHIFTYFVIGSFQKRSTLPIEEISAIQRGGDVLLAIVKCTEWASERGAGDA